MAKSYLEQRRELKLNGKTPAKVERAEKIAKGKFFADALHFQPSACMECKRTETNSVNPAGIVAHILPKRKKGGVPSMAKNPLNIMFFCGDCHTDFDNKGAAFVKKMKTFKTMRERVALMWPHIPQTERKNVPEYFRPHE